MEALVSCSRVLAIFLCIVHVTNGQTAVTTLPPCVNPDVNSITFDVDINTQLMEDNGLYYLYADVNWTVTNPANIGLDGFAVNFGYGSLPSVITDIDLGTDITAGVTYTPRPVNTCYSGFNHLWVISSDQSVCDTSSSAPQCSQLTQVPDACLCPQPNCTLFYPTSCRSVLELLGPDYFYHVTVLPTVTRLRYLMLFDYYYGFSISPYYREFANLIPTTTIMPPLDECDDQFKEQIKNISGPVSRNLSWSAVNGSLYYNVEVSQMIGGLSIFVMNQTAPVNQTVISGLEVCENYTFSVYGWNGTVFLPLPPTTHFTAFDLTLETNIPLETSTPPETTSAQVTPTASVSTTTEDACLALSCDFNANCIDLPDGTVSCGCNVGFRGDGFTCEDIDECSSGLITCAPLECVNTVGSYYCGSADFCANSSINDCHDSAVCENILGGGFQCTCMTGFSGNGTFCEDINECFAIIGICDFYASCTNLPGSFSCVCLPGFTGDGSICTDIDECSIGTDSCPADTECTNTLGSYICGPSGSCADPLLNNCDGNAACNDENGTVTCTCNPGYTGDGISCTDEIDCPGNCDGNATCVDTIGSFTCTCNDGFSGDGRSCTEEINCPGDCDINASCVDMIDNYTCICDVGFSGNGTYCEDQIDCPGDCDVNAFCIDTIGSYICGCDFGFTGNGTFCEVSTTPETCLTLPCSPNADCVEGGGENATATCVCKTGFGGNGFICQDIDECSGGGTDCSAQNRTCTNTLGSYFCELTDVTTCTDGSFLCHDDAICIDAPDGSTCSCKVGYTGDGFECEDFDECAFSPFDGCPPSATCVNTVGAYYCEYDLTCSSNQTINGYNFPSVEPGLLSFSEEKCEDTSRSIASIRCVLSQNSETATFNISTFVESTCEETVEDLTGPPYVNVSRKLDELQLITEDAENLTQRNVEDITQFFQVISEAEDEFSREDVQNVADITSHLSEYYGQEGQGGTASSAEKQTLLESIDVISRKLEGAAGEFVVESNDVNIAVQDTSNTNVDQTFVPRFYSESGPTVSPIQITIPSEAFDRAQIELDQGGTQLPSVRVVSIGFRSSNLFPSDDTADWVIASSLGNRTTTLGRISLDDPVEIVNREVDEQNGKSSIDSFRSELTKVECVFWDFNLGSWSSDGCSLVSTDPAVCECSHLTNFAVLVSTTEIPANFALSVVTYVGCGLSIIGLVCTVLFIALTRRLRKRHPMQIMLNLCSCLALALAFFIFGVESGVEKTGCSVLTVFLHYFLLATWLWMAIYSHTVYRDVVKVLDSYGLKYNIFAACAVGYGVPVVIVVLNAAIALGHVDANQPDDPFLESAYVARNFCWLRGNSLYFGFLLPAGIILVYNVFVFCMVIPKITCLRKKLQSSASPKSIRDNVTIALVMATTMGFTWIVGYLMLIADYEEFLIGMSWLFAILNTLQGVFIFLFTIVRTGEMKRFLNFGFDVEEKYSSTTSTGLNSRSPPRSPVGNNGNMTF